MNVCQKYQHAYYNRLRKRSRFDCGQLYRLQDYRIFTLKNKIMIGAIDMLKSYNALAKFILGSLWCGAPQP